MDYSYMVVILDMVSQEPIRMLVKGKDQLDRVRKVIPEHHVEEATQNLGPLMDADDYIKEQEGKQ